MTLERIETSGPMRSIRLQPRIKFHQRFGSKPIDPPLRITAHLDQTGIAQHLQMARHTRLMHPDLADQIGDRALAFANRIKDPPPSRFGDHFEDFERNRHRPIIRCTIYMRKKMYGAA